MKAMKAGIAVFCEKPLCLNLKEANDLVKTSRKLNVPFGVAHTYLGHWTSRLSRYIVQSGLLGDVRWVDSYYIQGWLATKLEATGQQQAVVARGPQARRRLRLRRRHRHARAHATALRHRPGCHAVSAQLETFVEGRQLDDHFTIYCKLSNGGKALVRASQICIGSQKRPRHRHRRHQRHAWLAPGRAGEPHHHAAEPARPRLLARRGHGRATVSCPRTCRPT
jgi:predicted dehydrogenase